MMCACILLEIKALSLVQPAQLKWAKSGSSSTSPQHVLY